MADNLCGPSTALKSFGDHVNRDRSLHQDRAGAGQAGPANFRSAPTINPSAEADYQAFMNTGLAPLSLMPGPENPAFMDPGAIHQQHQQHQQQHALHGHVHQGQQGLQGHHGHPGIHLNGNAVGAGASTAQHSQWAAEFASASAPAAVHTQHAPLSGHMHNPQALQAVNRLQHFSMGVAPGPMYNSPAAFPAYSAPAPVSSFAPPAAMAADTTARAADAPSGVGGLTEAQLEAQFAAAQAEMDFEDEMNAWMATHGPTAEERAAAQEQKINDDLERIADEVDALNEAADAAAVVTDTEEPVPDPEAVAAQEQAREEEELARIAGSIVATLSTSSNTRFQESSFMRLMHRMEAREVTVRGDSLVDGATGRPIEVIVQEEEQQQQQQQQQQQTGSTEQPRQEPQEQPMPGV